MSAYARTVEAAPQRISEQGRCRMGTFNGPIRDINILQLRRPLGFPAPKWFNNFRLKEWLAFQLSNDDWFICLAVYNTKTVGTAVVMAFNKQQQRMYHYDRKAPAWQLSVPRGLDDSRCWYQSSDFTIEIHSHLTQNRFSIKIDATGFPGLPDMSGNWTAHHSTEPIVVVQPFADNRPLYSHKALMPLEGQLEFDGRVSDFELNQSCAIVDDHKGFYPRVMQYDWVTGLGFSQQGDLLGFNLTDNQVQDSQRYNENCLWKDGRMTTLPPVKVERPQGVMGEWNITDEQGMVDLRFTPLADVPNQLNLGLVKIDYHGPTGCFSGDIVDSAGNKVRFDDFIGMGEQKYIRL